MYSTTNMNIYCALNIIVKVGYKYSQQWTLASRDNYDVPLRGSKLIPSSPWGYMTNTHLLSIKNYLLWQEIGPGHKNDYCSVCLYQKKRNII
jgi:hypothetical protein